MTRFRRVISCMTRRHKDASRSRLQEKERTQSTAKDNTVEDEEEMHNAESAAGFEANSNPPQMAACLSTLDLVSLGVGSCLGTGMYLTAGIVAATMAGPGGVIAFLVAGAASMLTGLCYAELAGMCPRTSGSAYMYAYITVGELAAFVIGWGLVLEYAIGTAAGAVALSDTLDALSQHTFSRYLKLASTYLGLPRLDLMATTICAVLTLLLASGAEMSAKVNNGLNITNISVLVFFVMASLVLGSSKNWVAGGFFPFGLAGVLRAIPTSYFAFIGFDTVAAAGEEARDPQRSIPRSILLSILFNALAYVIVILALTFDLPFYLLRPFTAVTDVLPQVHFAAGQYVVAAGAVTGEFAATFGSMFPLPRVLAAMAGDGLIFRPLGKICPKRHTPVRATLLSGLVAMVMATFFDLKLLIELVLIGTLLAYILVTFALLHVRLVRDLEEEEDGSPESSTVPSGSYSSLSRNGGTFDAIEMTDLTTEAPSVAKSNQSKLSGFKRQSNSSQTFSSSKLESNDSEIYTQLRKDNGENDEITTPFLYDAVDNHPRDHSERCSKLIHNMSQKRKFRVEKYDDLAPKSSQRASPRYFWLENKSGEADKSSFPLWLKIVTDVVDSVMISSTRVLCLLCSIYGVIIFKAVFMAKFWSSMADGNVFLLGILGIASSIFMLLVGIVTFMPQAPETGGFRAPLVPVLPIFVAYVNIYLMTSLSRVTWLLFGLWMSLGLLVYLLYGMNHSLAERPITTETALSAAERTNLLDDNSGCDVDDVCDDVIDDAKRPLINE